MCSESVDLRQGSCSVSDKHDGALSRVSVYRININVKESGKVILDPHTDSDQQQSLITTTKSPLFHAYYMFGRHP